MKRQAAELILSLKFVPNIHEQNWTVHDILELFVVTNHLKNITFRSISFCFEEWSIFFMMKGIISCNILFA